MFVFVCLCLCVFVCVCIFVFVCVFTCILCVFDSSQYLSSLHPQCPPHLYNTQITQVQTVTDILFPEDDPSDDEYQPDKVRIYSSLMLIFADKVTLTFCLSLAIART